MSNYSKTLKMIAGVAFALVVLVGTSASAAITSTLRQGSRGAQVMELQQFLNNCSAETMVDATGPGSKGMETSFFGPATRRAVIAFQNKFGVTTTATSAGLVGPMTRAAIAKGCGTGTGTTPVVTGGVSASLSSTSPASGTLVAGSAAANMAEFVFSNGTSSAVKISNVTLMRSGISVDTTLSNVYLYNGVNRLTDSASVSNGVITFNDPSGLFTVGANSTTTISVRSDIAAGVSGQTVGVTLTSFTVAGSAATATSVAGALHSTATVSGVATLDFNATTTPSASTVDPQTDYTMWQNVVTVGNRDAWLRSLRLRQIGSVNSSDRSNFRLYVDGTMVGSAVPSLDSMGYITFDLSSAPVKLLTGGRTIKVLGDIVGGSSRTFSFSLRQASDAWVTDSQLGTNILATANSSTFSARTSTSATINSGTLSI